MQRNIILLVEDNPNDEALALRAFRKNNILNDVLVARDGQEALDYLFGTGKYSHRKNIYPPRVILLDLNLPKVSGLEVLKRLRSDVRMQFVPVIVMTASQEEQEIMESCSLGASSYIRKPVDFDNFTEATRQLGLSWVLINESPLVKVPVHQGN